VLILRIPTPESGWNRMIQMTHVSKTFPNQVCALSDITLEIPAGQFALLLDPAVPEKTTPSVSSLAQRGLRAERQL